MQVLGAQQQLQNGHESIVIMVVIVVIVIVLVGPILSRLGCCSSSSAALQAGALDPGSLLGFFLDLDPDLVFVFI